MTVRECYESIGSDFDGVLLRLGSESIIKKFAIKFLDDKSFENLTQMLAQKNLDEAFRQAHTLKGICLNLGFDKLFKVSSQLTQILRTGTFDGTDELYKKVKEQYQITVDAIGNLLD